MGNKLLAWQQAMERKTGGANTLGVNFLGTPLKRRCGKTVEEDAEKSILESVPQDILIRILCGVDHDDLKQLFHVSSTIRDAVQLLVTLLLLLLHTTVSVPHAYTFSSLLIIFVAAAYHPRCSCHLHHFICCCWIDIYLTILGIYFPRIQQSFRTERSRSGTARRRTGIGREENRMKKIPTFKGSLHLIL